MIIARNLRLDPPPLTTFSIADEDNVLAPIRNKNDFFEQRKITHRAYAFNKWRDTFDQINDWEEMLEFHYENSNPFIKKIAISLIRKRY